MITILDFKEVPDQPLVVLVHITAGHLLAVKSDTGILPHGLSIQHYYQSNHEILLPLEDIIATLTGYDEVASTAKHLLWARAARPGMIPFFANVDPSQVNRAALLSNDVVRNTYVPDGLEFAGCYTDEVAVPDYLIRPGRAAGHHGWIILQKDLDIALRYLKTRPRPYTQSIWVRQSGESSLPETPPMALDFFPQDTKAIHPLRFVGSDGNWHTDNYKVTRIDYEVSTGVITAMVNITNNLEPVTFAWCHLEPLEKVSVGQTIPDYLWFD